MGYKKKIIVLATLVALGISGQAFGGWGCNFGVHIYNTTGDDLYIKDVEYKLSGSSYATVHSDEETIANGGEKEFAISTWWFCEDYHFKYKVKCEGSNTWSTFESEKLPTDDDGDCNVFYEVSACEPVTIGYDTRGGDGTDG